MVWVWGVKIARAIDYPNQEISFDKRLPDSLEYYKYRDGVLHSKVQIAKGDDTYSLIASWFDRNKEGWKPDIRTYADNDVYSGKDIKINVLKDAVIVNYSENGNRWIQLSKSKRTGELELGE